MKEPRLGLTPEQADELAEQGVTRLPGAVAASDVAAMADVIWRRLRARHHILREEPSTWRLPHPAQLTARPDDLAAMASPTVRAVLDDVLGAGGWSPPEAWGLPLVTLPGFARAWDVPHKGWHLDLQATPTPPRVARLFVLLGDLAPGGGGTGYVAGSHRVLRALARETDRSLKSGEARALLAAREPWFAALFSRPDGQDRRARFMDRPAEAAGVQVRVAEMTGQAGDVYVMDPLILHALTPNVSDRPRMMLTQWVYGRD